jgi:hypothetical protein
MPICPNCGVELAAEAESCPLCGVSLGSGQPHRTPESYLDPENAEKLTKEERRTIGWEVVSVSAVIAAVVVSAVNLLDRRSLTWALYPLASLALVWLLLTIPLKLRRMPVLAGIVAATAVPLFLVALNLIEGKLSWAFPIAVPIALIVEVSAGAAGFAARKAKRKGPNVLAFGLLAASATCIGIEATLSLQLFGRVSLAWSAIVASALVPVSGFLLYLHHRVTKRANLRKLFRL